MNKRASRGEVLHKHNAPSHPKLCYTPYPMPKRNEHDFEWSKLYVWKLLQRTTGYTQAFRTLVAEAKEAGDSALLKIIDGMKLEGELAYLFEPKPPMAINGVEIAPEAMLRPIRTENIPKLFTYFVDDEHESINQLRPSANTFLQDISPHDRGSPHFLKFLRRYESVIRFPIPPEILEPPFLEDYIVFQPCRILRSEDSEELKSLDLEFLDGSEDLSPQASSRIPVLLDLRFSPTLIEQQVRTLLKQVTALYASESPLWSQKMNWDDFQTCICAFDMRKSGKAWEEIGAKLNPLPHGTPVSFAKHKVATAERLISLVER